MIFGIIKESMVVEANDIVYSEMELVTLCYCNLRIKFVSVRHGTSKM